MSAIQEEHLNRLSDLEHLSQTAQSLSLDTHGREVDRWRPQYGSLIFTKMCCHTSSLLHLLPAVGGEQRPSASMIWDLSSIAVLTRAVIDSYYVFFYVAVYECGEAESLFRYSLWNFHAEKQRLDMLSTTCPANPEVPKLEASVARLKDTLVSNSFYQSLDTRFQRKLKKGEIGIFLSNKELSRRSGIGPDYYKAVFNYLSAYVHGYPFAVSQLTNGIPCGRR